jgi:hypothetical protein
MLMRPLLPLLLMLMVMMLLHLLLLLRLRLAVCRRLLGTRTTAARCQTVGRLAPAMGMGVPGRGRPSVSRRGGGRRAM